MIMFSLNGLAQHNSLAQQEYYGETAMQPYDTLTNYTSILYDILPTPSIYWNNDVTIDFGFRFPYFDTDYTYMHANGGGYIEFRQLGYEIYIYAGQFENHRTLPIFSDWRYRIDTAGTDIFKMEWRNVGILVDIESPTPTDHRMNFQVWLYENGIIEYRFGLMDLKNTPWYSVETGFTLPSGMTIGPWTTIKRRMIDDEYFFLNNNGNIEFLHTNAAGGDIFYGVPDSGTVMRFVPDEIVNARYRNLTKGTLQVGPNPVTDNFHIITGSDDLFRSGNVKLELWNQFGAKVFSENINVSDEISIAHLPAGIYSVCLTDTKGSRYTAKIIKQ